MTFIFLAICFHFSALFKYRLRFAPEIGLRKIKNMLVREWKKLLINFKEINSFWTDVYYINQAKTNGFKMRNSVNQ